MFHGICNLCLTLISRFTEYEKIKAADSILIVGGGPTGVELAAEIAADFPAKKVTLVHRGSRLLEFVGESASKKALNWLTSKKVEVILGQSVDVNSASDGVYKTSGGETIVADCHFICIGTPFGSAWLKETILKDTLDTRGRLMVDSNLRIKGHNNIFAIGDITDIPVSQLSPFLIFLRIFAPHTCSHPYKSLDLGLPLP